MRCEPLQPDPGRLVVAGDVDGVPVENRAVHSVGGQIDVGVGTGKRLELHGGGGAEGFLAGNEVQLDQVALHGHQCRALDGFIAGQIWKHG